MTSHEKDGWFVGLGWAALCVALLRWASGCAALGELPEPPTPADVATAEDFRDIVCAIAHAPSLKGAEAERIRELCEKEGDLRQLARDYGGCDDTPAE